VVIHRPLLASGSAEFKIKGSPAVTRFSSRSERLDTGKMLLTCNLVVGTKGTASFKVQAGRRNLVWALQKLCFWGRRLFPISARILLSFAVLQ